MSDRAVNWSSLELARSLSHRLAGFPAAPVAPTPPAPVYVRFPRRAAEEPVTPRPARPAAAAADATREAIGAAAPAVPPDGWRSYAELLGWALAVGRAHAAVIVDAQGFLLEARGIPATEAEVMAAGLRDLFASGDRLAPDGPAVASLSVQLGAAWVVAVRADGAERDSMALALLGPEPLFRDAREALAAELRVTLRYA